jgi:hypothetical protein
LTTLQKTALLLLAIGQVAAPAVLAALGLEIGGRGDPRITPAGYAFAVWGLIVSLGLGYAVQQVTSGRGSYERLARTIAWPLAGTYVGFVVWLVAAVTGWIWATVVIFVGMFLLLRHVYDRVLVERDGLPLPYRVFLEAQVGIYLGWTTIAIFANLAAALTFSGLEEPGVFGATWQGLILVAAAVNGLYGVRRTRASLTYTAAVLWAFVGVLVGLTQHDDTRALQVLTLAAIVLVGARFFYMRTGAWHRRQNRTS